MGQSIKYKRSRALLFLISSPFIFIYGLFENHFLFKMSIRGYIYEFINEFWQVIRVIIGKEYHDYSIKVRTYDFNVKAKKK